MAGNSPDSTPGSPDDKSLQELIVRALTGLDARARQSLDAATRNDPALRQFCAELDEVVSLLVGSKEWRSEKPSAELTAKIRSAVASKLPSAPAHFRTVMLEGDLGRSKTILGVILALLCVASLIVVAVHWWNVQRAVDRNLVLAHQVIIDTRFNEKQFTGWDFVGDGAWESGPDGLKVTGSDEPGAIVMRKGYDAEHALAFQLDVAVPGLEERSNAIIFLAEAADAPLPAFSPAIQPGQALTLEITRDGVFAYGPDQALLQSRPVSNAQPHFYQVRLEHLGPRVRVLINGETFFEGPASRPLHGNLHPGARLAGPQKKEVRFNAVRVER
jgi:hypothetical protein